MAKDSNTEPPVAPAQDPIYLVLDVVEHNGVRYAPDSDGASIPASEITPEQVAALIVAGVVSVSPLPQTAA